MLLTKLYRKILQQIWKKDMSNLFPSLKFLSTKPLVITKKRHWTNDDQHLKRLVENLLEQGQLQEFVK